MKDQKILGDYALGNKLGEGKFSRVREGKKKEETYAVKYMKKTSTMDMNKKFLDLLYNEVKILSQLDHPNIVKLYEFKEDGIIRKPSGKDVPVLYLVFELITGGDLFDYVYTSGRFSDSIARYYFRQLIDVLEFLYSKGIAHRDIKAQNILLDANFNLKLADFGFSALAAGKDGTGKMNSDKGTTGYKAPEILMGKFYEGEKVDIFAAGVLLFNMVGQRPPFNTASPMDRSYKLFYADKEKFWEDVCAKNPPGTFSPHLKSLLNALFAFSPAARPTIAEIKTHPWLAGPMITEEEIKAEFTVRKERVKSYWISKVTEAQARKKMKKEAEAKKKGTIGVFAGHNTGTRGLASESEIVAAATRKLPTLCHSNNAQTLLFTIEDPETCREQVLEFFTEQLYEIKESEKKYKIQGTFISENQKIVMNIHIESAAPEVNCIRAERVVGDKIEFLQCFTDLREMLTENEILI